MARQIRRFEQHDFISVKVEPPSAKLQLDLSATQYADNKMNDLKNELNSAKDHMDSYSTEQRELFNKFRQTIDTYRPLMYLLKQNYDIQNPTNAWLKMYEIYDEFDAELPTTGNIVTFHNAELPGSFVSCTNHYFATRKPKVKHEWYASSLAPGSESTNPGDILDDQYGYYESNKGRWLMSMECKADVFCNNGDVTKIENIIDFANHVGPDSKVGGVDIYTHDAGIDVSVDMEGNIAYNKQEELNTKIHLGAAIAGFLTMRNGALFIAKQYTTFETLTWNLIIIYAQMFEKFYLTKPLTSRPYNSEIYLVGIGFKGFEYKEQLIKKLINFDMRPILPKDSIGVLCAASLISIREFSKIVFGQQIKMLEQNNELLDKMSKGNYNLADALKSFRLEKCNEWLGQMKISNLPKEKFLPQKIKK